MTFRPNTLLCAAALLLSSACPAATLELTIDAPNKPVGKLMVKVVNSVEAYEGQAPAVAAQALEVSSTEAVQLSFPDLPAGQYAVLVMHDENGNGKLDTNVIGIPREGYGFSNNPRVMGKPNYSDASFRIEAADLSLRIELL